MFEGDPADICCSCWKFFVHDDGGPVTGLKCENSHQREQNFLLFISFVCFGSRYSSSWPRICIEYTCACKLSRARAREALHEHSTLRTEEIKPEYEI